MKKFTAVTGICLALAVIIYVQVNHNKVKADPRGSAYAGQLACVKCHSDIHQSYLQTAHYLASNPADETTIDGSFKPGANVFRVTDARQVVMEKQHGTLFQSYYLNGKLKRRYKFDIVMGGVKGESYLFWKENQLYQLPLSFVNALHQWSTSPGLGVSALDHEQSRSISSRCLQCHTSYIADLPNVTRQLNKGEEFDKTTLVYHIDCERCHGPGAKHVEFQTDNPGIKTAHFIKSYRSLNRLQKLDMCALCHSGTGGVMVRSAFEFVPGDSLTKFRLTDFISTADTAHPDVHGNQLQLLQSSKCYMKSKVMTCVTCHDVHQNSRGNVLLYAQKCLSCHNTGAHTFCTMKAQPSFTFMKANCVNCHMPALPTSVITAQLSSKTPPVHFFVHTHYITVYPQAAKQILAASSK